MKKIASFVLAAFAAAVLAAGAIAGIRPPNTASFEDGSKQAESGVRICCPLDYAKWSMNRI